MNNLFYATNECGFFGYVEAKLWSRRQKSRREQDLLEAQSDPLLPQNFRNDSYLVESEFAEISDDILIAKLNTYRLDLLYFDEANMISSALSTIELVLALQILKARGHDTNDKLLKNLSAKLYSYGKFLFYQTPWHPYFRNVDYLASLAALFFISSSLQKTESWFAFSARELLHEFWLQFGADGMHRTGSPERHGLAVMLVNAGMELGRRTGAFSEANLNHAKSLRHLPPSDFDIEEVPAFDSEMGLQHWGRLQLFDTLLKDFAPEKSELNISADFLLLQIFSQIPKVQKTNSELPEGLTESQLHRLKKALQSDNYHANDQILELDCDTTITHLAVAPSAQCFFWTGPRLKVFIRGRGTALAQVFNRSVFTSPQIEIRCFPEGRPAQSHRLPVSGVDFCGPEFEKKLAARLPSASNLLFINESELWLGDFVQGRPHYRRVQIQNRRLSITDYFRI